MRIAFITVGDTRRRTGGYLYHRELFARLPDLGIAVEEIVASAAPLDAQLAAAPSFGMRFDPSAYDVVVVDALARGVCAPWLDGWRAKRPLVAMIHELPSVAGNDPRDRILEQPLLRAGRLITVSEHGRDILLERGLPPERIRIVAPGFDRLQPVAPARKPASGLVALCVAQWIARKGITTLVTAWAARPRPGARLELVGETDADPGYAERVYASIAAYPRAAIWVRGVLSDAELLTAYAGADLFVLPSRYEGYGMAYAEALACGLPVIACTTGPVPELLGATPGMIVAPDACGLIGAMAGLLVPPDNVAALDAALSRLLEDTALRHRLAAGAHRRAAQLPGWDATARGFVQALVSLISSS